LYFRAAGTTLLYMKKTKESAKRTRKLTLAKESVRKLAGPALTDVAGGNQTNHCDTITLKCCLTR
jgi:hypothetical protein